MNDAEAEAYKQYQHAKRCKEQLQAEIEKARPRANQLKTLEHLWGHINDFVPRSWRSKDEPEPEK